jgi:hypothetical protein
MSGPSSRLQDPPCADQALAGSWDEEHPGMSRGPEPARVQASPYASRPGEDPLLLRGLWPVT